MLGKNRSRLIEKALVPEKFYGTLRSYARIQRNEWFPDIAVSRDPGSGGQLVAKMVAKKLKWQFYDKQILKELAEELGLAENIIRSVDEHPRTRFTDIFFAAFNPNYISEYDYIKNLKKLFLEAGKEKDVVFLGRGGNHILPPDKCLRVRITASLAERVRNTVKYEGKKYDDALAWVKKVEDKRNNFIRQYFNADPNSPNHFDIVINTDKIALTQARDIVITALKRKFPRHKF